MHPAFVYFDLGNVIALFDRDRAFRQMAAVCGASFETVRDAVMDGLQRDLERGLLGWPEFHTEFSRRTGTRSDSRELAQAAADMFTLNVPMLPIIASLERARVPLGILSNTCDIHWRHILSLRWGVIPGHFQEIVLSYRENTSKPESAMYEIAAKRAGVPTGSIFFCDDIPEHVAAARSAGWDAVVFVSATELSRDLAARGINLGM